MAHTTQNRHRATLTALWGVGVLLGVLVGVLMSDAIAGLIAGAAFIGLTGQMLKLWSGPSSSGTVQR